MYFLIEAIPCPMKGDMFGRKLTRVLWQHAFFNSNGALHLSKYMLRERAFHKPVLSKLSNAIPRTHDMDINYIFVTFPKQNQPPKFYKVE
jgi:hypothetical protein